MLIYKGLVRVGGVMVDVVYWGLCGDDCLYSVDLWVEGMLIWWGFYD